ncbi:exopolysaccharide regulatory tyrosine autokinase VpsO [Kistimonas scapharcae]|uniref:non-specific protein-tyrosine kinase n=2 Tax=Kistimonas scapharcae TaxID=1036133 RepID=A0ABP8UXZ1_9GAMM
MLQGNDVISLREIVHILMTYRWAIAGFTLAVTLLATLVVFTMTPIYQATAVLQIEQEQAKVVSIEEMYGIDGGGDSYLNTQFEVLKSRSVLEKVVNKLNLLDDPEFNTTLREKPWYAGLLNWRGWFGLATPSDEDEEQRILRDTINQLDAHVTIEPVRKTQIVRIHVTSDNPKMAAKIANAIASAYIESYMEAKLSLTLSATGWMQGRLTELSEKLRLAEVNLQDYREKEDLVDLEGVLTISSNELKALTESLVEVRRKLAISENINRQLKSGALKTARDYESLQAVLEHPLIQGLKQEEAKVQRQVMDMSRRYGPKHPKMISARSEMQSIQQNIRDQIRNIVDGVQRDYQIDKANEQSLSEAVALAKKQVQQINRKQFRLRALEREVRTNKDLYDAFFKRIQETSATSDLQTANARIVDEAFPPKVPVKPKKKLIIVLSALLGLMLSSGVAFLLEMLNNTIRSTRDVEDKLNLPVLGVLPKLTDKTLEGKVQKLFLDKSQHGFGEAVRTIRTSINLTALDKDHRLFAVTSTMPGEGKSSTAANLALSLGQLGKTLIIDCDLRRPTVGKTFDVKGGSAGLANLLAGTAEKAECVHQVDGIDVIPCGQVPPNPQELLSTEAFNKLITTLKQDYEYVVVDCPPVQNVSDALMISRLCDGLLYVIEAGRAQVGAIQNTVGRLLQAKAPLTGVVLNKIDPTKKDAYGYSQGYYDYEGYHSKEA